MANSNEVQPFSNPFLLNVVVHKLFGYLPLQDILEQRKVCKLWQEIGLTHIRKYVDLIELSFGTALASSIEKFLEMWRSFSFKFTNVSIYYWDDELNPSTPNTQQTNRLFDEYGTHLKVIALNLCGTTTCRQFLSDVLVNKAPNLEQLLLQTYPRGPETPVNSLFSGEKKLLKLKRLTLFLKNGTNETTLLADLFESSPNLESLKVELEGGDGLNYEMVNIIRTFANKGNICNLKELCIRVVNSDVLKILATSFKSAPLENLKFQIYQMGLTMPYYTETFFGDHKDTLKNVNITFSCIQFLNKFTFPNMKNLQILSISDWYCFDRRQLHAHRAPFTICNFGTQFPNLLSLYLFERSKSHRRQFFNLDDMFPEDTIPLLTLKNLRLPPVSKPEILRRLGRIFPNVLKLFVVPQAPAVLRELWTTWPEVKMLHISIMSCLSHLSRNLDSVFTGVADSDRSRTFPSISHLKKIRHLKIDKYSNTAANVRDLKITDETARLALGEMKELVSLYVSRDHHEISPSCVEYLRSELDMLETEKVTENQDIHLVKYDWQKRSRWSISLDYERSNFL